MRIRELVAGVLICCCMAGQAAAHDVCGHVDLAWLSGQVPLSAGSKIVFKQAQGELCEVIVSINGKLAPVYAGKDFIVAGRMYRGKHSITRETMAGLTDIAKKEKEDAKKQKALKVEERKAFFRMNHTSLEPLVSMTFGPGSAKKGVYVITDPNCAHCKKLLPLMEEVAFEAGLTLNVIIYPVLGNKSRKMASHALCQNFTYAQYKEMSGQGEMMVCDRSTDLLGKTKAVFASANISFVPLVVAGDGSWVVEGNDINEVRRYLGIECEPGDVGVKKGCGPLQKE